MNSINKRSFCPDLNVSSNLQLVAINNETKTKAAKRYCMNDVAILTQLRWKETGHVVTVVNTHVYFGEFKKPDLQVLQVNLMFCLKTEITEGLDGVY